MKAAIALYHELETWLLAKSWFEPWAEKFSAKVFLALWAALILVLLLIILKRITRRKTLTEKIREVDDLARKGEKEKALAVYEACGAFGKAESLAQQLGQVDRAISLYGP